MLHTITTGFWFITVTITVLIILISSPSAQSQPLQSQESLNALKLHNEERKRSNVGQLTWSFDLADVADDLAREHTRADLCTDKDAFKLIKSVEGDAEKRGHRVNLYFKKSDFNPIMAKDDILSGGIQYWIAGNGPKNADYTKERKKIISKKETHIGCSSSTGKPSRNYFCTVAACVYRSSPPAGKKSAKDEL
ncbi:hypothetical protein BC829DRAFT_429992 [Chytridium lagenaria]|nr:hypothetical protein BC829DRAFT_429992 [Chytridium lagenaria]